MVGGEGSQYRRKKWSDRLVESVESVEGTWDHDTDIQIQCRYYMVLARRDDDSLCPSQQMRTLTLAYHNSWYRLEKNWNGVDVDQGDWSPLVRILSKIQSGGYKKVSTLCAQTTLFEGDTEDTRRQ
jgi:hypothetical protein